jgi:hypothetical protein
VRSRSGCWWCRTGNDTGGISTVLCGFVNRCAHDGLVTLKECVTIDEVEVLARVRANVGDDAVGCVVITAKVRVKSTRPDLSIGGELKRSLRQARRRVTTGVCNRVVVAYITDIEEEGLQAADFRGRNLDQASGLVDGAASSLEAELESIRCGANEGSPNIDDTSAGLCMVG